MDNNDSYSLTRVKQENVINEDQLSDMDAFEEDTEPELELEGEEQEEQQNSPDNPGEYEEEDLDRTADVNKDYVDPVDAEPDEEEDGCEPTVDDDEIEDLEEEAIAVNSHKAASSDPNVWTLPKEKSACTLDEIRRGQTINRVALNECPVVGCGKKINRANPEASQGTISSGLKTHVIFVHYNSKKQTKKRKHADNNWNIKNSPALVPTPEKRPMSSSSLYSVLAGLTQQQTAPLPKPNSNTNSLSHLKASLLDMKMRPSSGQFYDSYDGGSTNNFSNTTNERIINSDRSSIDRTSERNNINDRYSNDITQNDEPDPTHALNAFIKIICRRTGSNVGSAGIAEARKIIDKFTTSLISSSQTIADHYLTPPSSLYPGDLQQRPEVSPSDIVLAYKMLQKS